ncbi:ribonuclease HIII [Mycoplasmatota bacterium]|nr:ribonuclease HIII [Mycoplasmatota bacterium]
MKSISIIVNENTLNKIKSFYEDHLIPNNNKNALFIAKIDGCTITAYHTKKVLFQGKNSETEAAMWEGIKNDKKSVSTNQNQHSYYLDCIGSDEVGTGDYFGPVVVVSAFLDKDKLPLIKTLNIDDSKKLTDNDIMKIAPTLFKNIPYSLLVVHNEKYNEVMKQKDMNLNKLKAVLHKQAISNLLNKIKQQPPIIIDQFCSIEHFNKYINERNFTKGIHFHTKAESKYASVACASMMARYIFLQEMKKLSESLKTTLNKGASNQVDIQGKELVQKYGPDILNKVAKHHFKNTEKIKALID